MNEKMTNKKMTNKEISFETKGIHIMELEGRDEFRGKTSCCGGYGNGAAA